MKKILVIRLSAIGDLILTSAPLLNLKISFPEAKIYLLTRRDLVDLAKNFDGVDEVLELPPQASFRQLFRMAEYLDQEQFDTVIDLHGSLRSFYLGMHISAPNKVCYPKRRWERLSAVHFKKINPSPPHTIDLYNVAVKRSGGKIFATRPVLNLHRLNRPSFKFENNRPVIAIAPGASYQTKQWPRERFVTIIKECTCELNGNIVLLLTNHDKEILNNLSDIPTDRIKSFIGTDLIDLIPVIAGSKVMLSNDSAMMHLSSAVGTPVIGLFGPTHPTLGFSPRGMDDAIMQVDEPCRPCSLHGRRKCFREAQYCFERIAPLDVLQKMAEILNKQADRGRAIFIDRDGTLIKEKNFLKNPEDIEPEVGSFKAVRMAREAGYKVIVLSNQSGVARGYFDETTVRQINARLMEIFNNNSAPIDDIYYCPHYTVGQVDDYAIECNCRKPAPGMAELAGRQHNLDLIRSFVVGDKLSDVNLAAVMGGRSVLVRTGYGSKSEAKMLNSNSIKPMAVENNLPGAVKYIVDIEDLTGLE